MINRNGRDGFLFSTNRRTVHIAVYGTTDRVGQCWALNACNWRFERFRFTFSSSYAARTWAVDARRRTRACCPHVTLVPDSVRHFVITRQHGAFCYTRTEPGMRSDAVRRAVAQRFVRAVAEHRTGPGCWAEKWFSRISVQQTADGSKRATSATRSISPPVCGNLLPGRIRSTARANAQQQAGARTNTKRYVDRALVPRDAGSLNVFAVQVLPWGGGGRKCLISVQTSGNKLRVPMHLKHRRQSDLVFSRAVGRMAENYYALSYRQTCGKKINR